MPPRRNRNSFEHSSYYLKPSIAQDGCAYFVSWLDPSVFQQITGYYNIIAYPGGGIYILPWTWHRVDYDNNNSDGEDDNIDDEDDDNNEYHNLAVGGSFFYFSPYDFIMNNPIFAWLIIPSIILELIGYHAQ